MSRSRSRPTTTPTTGARQSGITLLGCGVAIRYQHLPWITPDGVPVCGRWFVDQEHAQRLAHRQWARAVTRVPNAPGPVAARLGRFGLVRPGEYVLTTLTERPDLDSHDDAHHTGMWAPLMVDSEVADRMFPWAPRAMGA